MKYRIGDIVFEFDFDKELVHHNFNPFQCDDSEAAVTRCFIAPPDDISDAIQMTTGQIKLMRARKKEVVEGANGIDVIYPLNRYVTSVRVSKDRKSVKVYVAPGQEGKCKDELYKSMKDVVFVILEGYNRFALDASSLVYKGRAVLISSDPDNVLANMCAQKGVGAVLNDNNNLIGIHNDRIYVYGTPWCGRHHVRVERTPIGGIFFVKKSEAHRLADLKQDQRQLLMLVRCLSPLWREGLLDQCLKPIQRIEPSIYIRQLQSVPGDAAVELIKKEFDAIGW